MNTERFKELKKLEKQLMDFMYEYGNPHMTLVVTQRGVTLMSDECFVPYKLRD